MLCQTSDTGVIGDTVIAERSVAAKRSVRHFRSESELGAEIEIYFKAICAITPSTQIFSFGKELRVFVYITRNRQFIDNIGLKLIKTPLLIFVSFPLLCE